MQHERDGDEPTHVPIIPPTVGAAQPAFTPRATIRGFGEAVTAAARGWVEVNWLGSGGQTVKIPMALGAAFLAAAMGQAAAQQQPTASSPATGQPVLEAHATLAGPGITGTAEFREVPDATGRKVEVTVTVKGLAPGLHGMHLHAVGKCEAPGFTSAGGHFDPGPFGNSDPDMNHPFHMGDLPNLQAGANGEARASAVTTRVTLSQGPLSVFDPDGTALIIHANPDQGVTGGPKSGLSGGPRVACGVLEKK